MTLGELYGVFYKEGQEYKLQDWLTTGKDTPEESSCDHFYSFSIDCERMATCNSCGHTWVFDGVPCGNINDGTFKVYGKEQHNPQESS